MYTGPTESKPKPSRPALQSCNGQLPAQIKAKDMVATQQAERDAEQRVRVMVVGTRVRSHKHFSDWLNSEEPMSKLRSPGRHYSSLSHCAARREGSSEGNRFIEDDQL